MKFEQWLVSTGKSPNTATKYASAITGVMSNWALEAGLLDSSLSELDSVEELRQVSERLRQLDIFVARNSVGKGMYGAALNTYAAFLEELTQSSLGLDLEEIVEDSKLSPTQKSDLINIRLGQGVFRRKLVDYWGGCAVTRFRDTRFLVASHIKPWSHSNDQERLDPFNGILLLPNIDKAFDLGFITFEYSGKIAISAQLECPEILGVHPHQTVSIEKSHYSYLEYHRCEVFNR